MIWYYIERTNVRLGKNGGEKNELQKLDYENPGQN